MFDDFFETCPKVQNPNLTYNKNKGQKLKLSKVSLKPKKIKFEILSDRFIPNRKA